MNVELVYEDEWCLIVNKPNNLLVHHSHYARNSDEISLVEWVKTELSEIAVPVHRLDRKTSGLILFVKEKAFASVFQNLFTEQSIQKKYHALVRGHLPESGIIDSPVKNDRGNYKEACTHFVCLEQFDRDFEIEPYSKQRYSLVEFTPKTGRMHQLRIHANKIAHPIINDPKYGNRHHNHYFEHILGINQLFLHAYSLKFIHPYTQQEISCSAAVPDFWNVFLIAY